jgi:hypothetical protein
VILWSIIQLQKIRNLKIRHLNKVRDYNLNVTTKKDKI